MSSLALGSIVATPAALAFAESNGIHLHHLLARHASGDDGDLEPEDKAANARARADGSRVFSSYKIGTGKIWIITEAVGDDGQRASTCCLLPSEY